MQGKSGRVVQIFHASVPAADFALGSQPQPRHLVGIQAAQLESQLFRLSMLSPRWKVDRRT